MSARNSPNLSFDNLSFYPPPYSRLFRTRTWALQAYLRAVTDLRKRAGALPHSN